MNLFRRLQKESLSPDAETIARLERFTVLLHEWNQVHNFTGAKTIEAIHANIIDSLYPLTFVQTPQTLLDVGTGAGFPGLVLAIALPDTEVVLSEPLKKRVSFLRYACIDIGLGNVNVEARRVEHLKHVPFDLITSRAVTRTKLLLELTRQVSDAHTGYLFYKGSRVFDELEDVQHQLDYDIVQKNQRNYLYIRGRE
jgi:16S rRNA (guanine527-N7)-methyltransferase